MTFLFSPNGKNFILFCSGLALFELVQAEAATSLVLSTFCFSTLVSVSTWLTLDSPSSLIEKQQCKTKWTKSDMYSCFPQERRDRRLGVSECVPQRSAFLLCVLLSPLFPLSYSGAARYRDRGFGRQRFRLSEARFRLASGASSRRDKKGERTSCSSSCFYTRQMANGMLQVSNRSVSDPRPLSSSAQTCRGHD